MSVIFAVVFRSKRTQHPLCVLPHLLFSSVFGFLSHAGESGRRRKTPEGKSEGGVGIKTTEGLVQLVGDQSCMARGLRDGWLTWA